ncbi:hypothetical protein HHI36_005029 [Cryptolaemus montrouzieri]|uniref:MADF domain-containing protein n=1 Tax=Cryptolaemus montrouzieri TaxID=559131 RepID=A0ABD2NTH6_9CUCU
MENNDTSFVSIADYICHLSKELEIEGANGLDGNEMEVIALIRNCPFLYDRSFSDFKDIEKKNEAWEAIASVFNVSALDLRQYWRNMRESFTRYTSKSENMKTYYTYFDEMNFLLPFIHRRNRSPGSSSNTIVHLREESNTSASSEPEITSTDHELKKETLIDLIHNNPVLFDRRHKDAKNHDLKLKTWKKVARELEIPVSDCVNRWKNLRERYSKERRQRKMNPESKKWRYSHTQMQNKRSGSLFNTEAAQTLDHLDSMSPHLTEHQYCRIDPDDQEVEAEYIGLEVLDNDYSNESTEKKFAFNTNTDDTCKDEDELFALAIAAELRKIASIRRKMKLKADIYRLLSSRSDDELT